MSIQKEPLPETPTDTPAPHSRAPLGWFFAGAVIGAAITVGVMTVVSATRTPGRAAQMTDVSVNQRQPTLQNTRQAPPANASEMALTDERPFAPKVVTRPQNTQGEASAPVMIIEYSDFNCGFCRRFHADTLQKVIDAYVKTGKARISYKHYPFLTATSAVKAEASECAAEQAQFWPYHDALFGGSVDGMEDEASVREALGRLAGDLNLDVKQFQACMTGGTVNARVQDDAGEGQRLGVTGTPSFLINGKPLVGAQPFEAFQQAIEAALAGTK